jgi:hypothetical protein
MRIHLPRHCAAVGRQLLQAVFFFKQQALVFLSFSYILTEVTQQPSKVRNLA